MLRPPFLNFPFQFYKNPSRNPYYFQNFQTSPISPTPIFSYNHENNQSVKNEKNKSNKNPDTFLFDLFGLKIYYDDRLRSWIKK